MLSTPPPDERISNLNTSCIENLARLILIGSIFIMQINKSFQLEIIRILIDFRVLVDAGHDNENGVTLSKGIGSSVNCDG